MMTHRFYCLSLYDDNGETYGESFIALDHIQTIDFDIATRTDDGLTHACFHMRDGLSFITRVDTTAYEELHEIMLGG